VTFRVSGPRAGLAALLLAASAGGALAQSSLYDTDYLRDLPGSRDVFSLLETSEPLTIAASWDGGGLYTGEAGRLLAPGASWTQTVFQLDGLDVSDPLAGGRPLILPWHESLDTLDVAIGGARRDPVGPGPLVGLATVRPQDAWRGTLALDGRFGGGGASVPPAVARLDAGGGARRRPRGRSAIGSGCWSRARRAPRPASCAGARKPRSRATTRCCSDCPGRPASGTACA
jgi:hypothetical protein